MPTSTTRQRGRRHYSMEQHGQVGNVGQQMGDFFLAATGYRTQSLSYDTHGTTLRLLPGVEFDDDGNRCWAPYRVTDSQLGFGDWIRRYTAVWRAGATGGQKVSFITHDPADPACGPDAEMQSPGFILWSEINRAVKAKQDRGGWAGLLQGGSGRAEELPRPTPVYVAYGALVQRGGKDFTNDRGSIRPPRGLVEGEDIPVVFMKRTAGEALLRELNREVEGYAGDPEDFAARYLHGDPVALSSGKFVHFYRKQDGPPGERQQQQGQGAPAAFAPVAAGGGGQGRTEAGYDVVLWDSYAGIPARLDAFEPYLRQKLQPFDDILSFPTYEEQAQLLADKFPPDVIEYAWRDHPEWIPDSVREKARAMSQTHVAVGGYGMPPQPGADYQPPQPQQPTTPPVSGVWGGGGQSPIPQGQTAPPAAPQTPPQAPTGGFQPQPAQQQQPQQPQSAGPVTDPGLAAGGFPAGPPTPETQAPATQAPAAQAPATQAPAGQPSWTDVPAATTPERQQPSAPTGPPPTPPTPPEPPTVEVPTVEQPAVEVPVPPQPPQPQASPAPDSAHARAQDALARMREQEGR